MSEPRLLAPPVPNWSYRNLFDVLLILGIAFSAAFWIDVLVTANRNGDAVPGDLRRIVDLCEIFAHGFGAALVLIFVWRMLPDFRQRLLPFAFVLFLPGLLVQGLKAVVARRRPLSFESETPGHLELPTSIADSWAGFWPQGDYALESFPSGHAAGAVALAIGLSWLFPRGRVIFWPLAVLACFQRITSGAHWLSDVIAGASVAFVVAFVIFRLEQRREAKHLVQRLPEGNSSLMTEDSQQREPPRKAA